VLEELGREEDVLSRVIVTDKAIADLRFELEVTSSAVEVELVLVV
jgi:hypothetical protein